MHQQSEKKLVTQQYLPTYSYNMANFGPLAAEIVSLVWGTPGNFNGFRVLAALLHGTVVVGVSQTLRRWTEGATYIRQGGHRVGHWPTFLVTNLLLSLTAKECVENQRAFGEVTRKIIMEHFLCPWPMDWRCATLYIHVYGTVKQWYATVCVHCRKNTKQF